MANNQYALMPGQMPQPGMQAPPQGMPMQPGMGTMPPPTPQPTATPPVQQQLTPEIIEQMLALQMQSPEQEAVERQMRLAEQLRADSKKMMSSGRMVGGRYVGPGLAQAAASLYNNYRASKMDDDSSVRTRNLGVEKKAATRGFFDKLTGRKKDDPLPHMGDEGE